MEREIFRYSRLREELVFGPKFAEIDVHDLTKTLNVLSYGKIRRLFVPQRVKIILNIDNIINKILGEMFILSMQFVDCQMDVEDKRKVTLIRNRYDFNQPVKIEENKFEAKSRNN